MAVAGSGQQLQRITSLAAAAVAVSVLLVVGGCRACQCWQQQRRMGAGSRRDATTVRYAASRATAGPGSGSGSGRGSGAGSGSGSGSGMAERLLA